MKNTCIDKNRIYNTNLGVGHEYPGECKQLVEIPSCYTFPVLHGMSCYILELALIQLITIIVIKLRYDNE